MPAGRQAGRRHASQGQGQVMMRCTGVWSRPSCAANSHCWVQYMGGCVGVDAVSVLQQGRGLERILDSIGWQKTAAWCVYRRLSDWEVWVRCGVASSSSFFDCSSSCCVVYTYRGCKLKGTGMHVVCCWCDPVLAFLAAGGYHTWLLSLNNMDSLGIGGLRLCSAGWLVKFRVVGFGV